MPILIDWPNVAGLATKMGVAAEICVVRLNVCNSWPILTYFTTFSDCQVPPPQWPLALPDLRTRMVDKYVKFMVDREDKTMSGVIANLPRDISA